MPHLSIVIPAYNEEQRIGHTLTGTFDFLDQQSYDAEVIVVNDGSRDQTDRAAAQAVFAVQRIDGFGFDPEARATQAYRDTLTTNDPGGRMIQFVARINF